MFYEQTYCFWTCPSLKKSCPPCRGGGRHDEVHPVLQFSDSWILTLRKFKSSYRKIKKDNWTLVYWAYSSIHIALNTPYTHTQTPFVSEPNYCRRSEQVDKVPRCLNLCCFHYSVFFLGKGKGVYQVFFRYFHYQFCHLLWYCFNTVVQLLN